MPGEVGDPLSKAVHGLDVADRAEQAGHDVVLMAQVEPPEVAADEPGYREPASGHAKHGGTEVHPGAPIATRKVLEVLSGAAGHVEPVPAGRPTVSTRELHDPGGLRPVVLERVHDVVVLGQVRVDPGHRNGSRPIRPSGTWTRRAYRGGPSASRRSRGIPGNSSGRCRRRGCLDRTTPSS